MLSSLLSELFGRRQSGDLAKARALLERGRPEEARSVCLRLLDRASTAEGAGYLLALIELQQGNLEHAAERLRKLVETNPDEAVYKLRLAQTYAAQQAYARAIPIYESVLHQGPPYSTDAELWFAQAEACSCADQADRAVDCLRRAVELAPDFAEATLNLGLLLARADAAEEARFYLRRSLALKPSDSVRLHRALVLTAVHSDTAGIERERERYRTDLDELLASPSLAIKDPEKEVGQLPFLLAYHGRNDRDLAAKLAQIYRRSGYGSTEPARVSSHGGKIRLGLVSTNFYMHSVGLCTIGLVRALSRERFEIFVFSIDPKQDAATDAFQRAADHYVELPAGVDPAREAIAAAKIDCLIFADIGMHPTTYFLAFWRLAPLQMVTSGHPVTTGIDTIDCFISAAAVEPAGAQEHYTERLAALEGFFLPAYPRPVMPTRQLSRRNFGIPARAHFYFCPQMPMKLHPEFDRVIAQILKRDPAAVVALIEPDQARIKLALQRRISRSIAEDRSRTVFLPRLPFAQYMDLLADADVVLDTLHFGGGNTSYQACAVGTPIASVPAPFVRGRYTMGCYQAMEMQQWLARDIDGYIDLAVRIASEPDLRQQLHALLLARNHAIFEQVSTVRALENLIAQTLLRA